MTDKEKLDKILDAAWNIVAIAKQERYKNIRLDSMEKALTRWDDTVALCMESDEQ